MSKIAKKAALEIVSHLGLSGLAQWVEAPEEMPPIIDRAIREGMVERLREIAAIKHKEAKAPMNKGWQSGRVARDVADLLLAEAARIEQEVSDGS